MHGPDQLEAAWRRARAAPRAPPRRSRSSPGRTGSWSARASGSRRRDARAARDLHLDAPRATGCCSPSTSSPRASGRSRCRGSACGSRCPPALDRRRVVRARPGRGLPRHPPRGAGRALRGLGRRAADAVRPAAGERQPHRGALGHAHGRRGARPARGGPPALRAHRPALDERGPRRRDPHARARRRATGSGSTSTTPSRGSAPPPAGRACSRSTTWRPCRRPSRCASVRYPVRARDLARTSARCPSACARASRSRRG